MMIICTYVCGVTHKDAVNENNYVLIQDHCNNFRETVMFLFVPCIGNCYSVPCSTTMSLTVVRCSLLRMVAGLPNIVVFI